MDSAKKISWFDKLTIMHRLTLIGVLAVLGMVTTGLIHNTAVNKVQEIGDELRIASEKMEMLDGLSNGMFVEFESASRYLQFSDKTGRVSWQEFSDDNDETLERLVKELPTETMRNDAKKLLSTMIKFDNTFLTAAKERVLLGFGKDDGLLGELRKSADSIETDLEEHNMTDLVIAILQLRKIEKEFMMQHTNALVDRFKQKAKDFYAVLAASNLNERAKNRVEDEMKLYQKSFIAYEENLLKLLKTEDDLRKIYQDELHVGISVVDEALTQYIKDINTNRKELQRSQILQFWGTLLFIVLGVVALIIWITRSITRPLGEVVEAMDVLEKGEIRHVKQGMRGAIGELVESLGVFQAQAVETARLRQVVETTPQATMIADKDSLIITYMNPAAKQLFKKIESALPCSVDQIVGQCIDIFHKNPGHQRSLLSNEASFPMSASFVAAGRSIQFSAYTLKTSEGAWDSIMVSWNDETEQAELATDFENNIGTMVEELIAAATEMQASSDELSSMAEQSLGQATSVSAGAEEANHNVTNVAAAAEELSVSISEITQQVRGAVDISEQAVVEAEETNQTVSKLSSVSEEIGQVVSVITDIAEQTNLLALNASIEAARAGEAGRGFAVVAGEVKELANQTAKATEQISKQILAIQSESNGAASAIKKIGETIQEMNTINEAIAMAADEQNNATREIAQSVHLASDATVRVTGAIGDVRSAAEDTGRSAAEVKNVSNLIREKGEALSGRVTGFLDSLRNR